MSLPTQGQSTKDSRAKRLLRALVAMGMLTVSFALLPASIASAEGSSIGVFVDQTPPTQPAPSEPVVATPAAPPTTAPATPATTPVTTVPPVAAPDTLPDVLPPSEPVKESQGFVQSVKDAAKTTRKLVSDVLSGKPVADAAQALLPAKVADVVVPAVRTASTFVFPIGLAGAVIAFLALQQRIDQSDPKLSAAPLAHDDDVVTFL